MLRIWPLSILLLACAAGRDLEPSSPAPAAARDAPDAGAPASATWSVTYDRSQVSRMDFGGSRFYRELVEISPAGKSRSVFYDDGMGDPFTDETTAPIAASERAELAAAIAEVAGMEGAHAFRDWSLDETGEHVTITIESGTTRVELTFENGLGLEDPPEPARRLYRAVRGAASIGGAAVGSRTIE